MTMMQLWAAVLIKYGVATGTGQLPLDMAPNSVDDMYDNCSDKMKSEVEKKYLQEEINMNENFKLAWELSENAYKKASEAKKRLEKDLFKAIYVYTLNKPGIHRDFNHAVRTQKSQYKTTFRYHALHFFLTRALQTLKPKKNKCLTSYRRTNVSFSQDVLNKKFRFGSFTSSSQGNYPSINFGKTSCFKIFTCFGADVHQYSYLKYEKEVLIPPYEIFKVTKVITGSKRKIKTCEVIYEVRSKGTSSNLNCTLFHR